MSNANAKGRKVGVPAITAKLLGMGEADGLKVLNKKFEAMKTGAEDKADVIKRFKEKLANFDPSATSTTTKVNPAITVASLKKVDFWDKYKTDDIDEIKQAMKESIDGRAVKEKMEKEIQEAIEKAKNAVLKKYGKG